MKSIFAEKILWEVLNKWKKSDAETSRFEFLRSTPFFSKLSNWQLKQINEVFYERTYQDGEFIFEQLQPGAALFFIEDGQVTIQVQNKLESPLQLATLTKGQFVGELALLDESPRSASAVSVGNTKLLALYRKDLEVFSKTKPEIASEIYKALAMIVGDRLKATNELLHVKKVAA